MSDYPPPTTDKNYDAETFEETSGYHTALSLYDTRKAKIGQYWRTVKSKGGLVDMRRFRDELHDLETEHKRHLEDMREAFNRHKATGKAE